MNVSSRAGIEYQDKWCQNWNFGTKLNHSQTGLAQRYFSAGAGRNLQLHEKAQPVQAGWKS